MQGSTIAQEQFDTRRNEYEIAAANLLEAQALGKAAELNLEFTQVKAPIDGRISRRFADEGNFIYRRLDAIDAAHHHCAIQSALCHLRCGRAHGAQVHPPRSFRRSELLPRSRRIRCGSRSRTRKTFRTKARWILWTTVWTRKPAHLRARALVDNSDGLLTPGLFVRVQLKGRGPYPALLIPDEAIGTDQSKRFVMVVDKEGLAQRRFVTTGRLHDGLRAVEEGLTPEDRVIVERPLASPARNACQGQGSPARQGLICPMNFSRIFIDRPIFASVLSILIVLVGSIAYQSLPIAQYPEVAPPTIVVRASYPGASPQVIAETVATPIEQEVNGVEDMLYMSSQSTSDGAMTLTITFKLGTDLDKAQVLVQNRVAIAEPRLPEEVRRVGVTTLKRSPDLLLVVHMVSPDDSYDQLYISNYATLQVREQLKRVEGVGDVNVFGAREYSMRIWLDPSRLTYQNLTTTEIITALQNQNVQVAAGVIGQPPLDT